MHIYKSFATLVLTTGIFLSSPVLAQTTQAPFGGRGALEDQSVYHPPEAYVLKADGTVQEDGTVQGSITFWNKSQEILGDMTYVIELLGALPPSTASNPIVEDNAPVYDIFSSPERFVLIGGEKKTISYTYTPPKNIPAGDYRIEITISNGRGRTLGWYDVPVHFTKEAAALTELRPGDITIAEYGEEKFAAETGPNVTAGKNITISATASSVSARTAVPVLDVYPFSPTRPLIKSIRGQKITSNKNGGSFSMNVPTSTEPGVYIGMLSLRDASTNELVSNLVKYRWVVRGAGADVLHVRMKSYGYEQGDVMSFAVDYVGAADAETLTNGTITLALHDSEGELGSLTDPNTELSDKILTGEATISLPRKLVGEATADITITDDMNSPLTTYAISYPLMDKQLTSLTTNTLVSHLLIYGGVAIVAIGAITLFMNSKGKKHRKR